MKTIITWTLVLTMGLSLCACGAESTSEPASSLTSENVDELTEAAETITVTELSKASDIVEIVGAVTPGAVVGCAENSVNESCDASVTLDGEALADEIDKTDTMYESADQSGEESEEEASDEQPAA